MRVFLAACLAGTAIAVLAASFLIELVQEPVQSKFVSSETRLSPRPTPNTY